VAAGIPNDTHTWKSNEAAAFHEHLLIIKIACELNLRILQRHLANLCTNNIC